VKTKPMYLYWSFIDIPGLGLCHSCVESKAAAVQGRRADIANGFSCGPVVRVDVPLPVPPEPAP
jgi:hypothetical protein